MTSTENDAESVREVGRGIAPRGDEGAVTPQLPPPPAPGLFARAGLEHDRGLRPAVPPPHGPGETGRPLLHRRITMGERVRSPHDRGTARALWRPSHPVRPPIGLSHILVSKGAYSPREIGAALLVGGRGTVAAALVF
jgi:hypothetical protein